MNPIPTRAIAAILGAALAIAALLWLVNSRDHWRDQAQAEKSAHATTVQNYRTAAETARRADAENKARVEAAQVAITERTSREYQARLADARATYERLRAQSKATVGRAGTTSMSVIPKGSSGTPGPAEQDGFSLTDRLTATEQALQLDQLIRWVNGQTKVNNAKQ